MSSLPFPHPVRTEWKLLAILRRDEPAITQTDCSRRLGVSINTIRHWLAKPLYQSFENWFLEKSFEGLPLPEKQTRAAVKEELDEFAVEMLSRLREIVETSNDDKLVASIGFDALDRAGYSPPQRDSGRAINFILTPEVLATLSQRKREIADTSEVVLGEVINQ